MLKLNLKLFKNNFFPLALFLIVFVLCIANYKWNTWLLGWDVIMPEFNFKLNFWRFLMGGFQEFQGLGVVPVMQKSADLPRLLILWFFSFIFPTSFLRWFYQFLMLLIGPFGVFYLLKYLFRIEIKTSVKTDLFAFLGALFYLLNLGTMQNFYAPLSMFTTWYGFLPWLSLFFIKFAKFGGRKNLLIFLLVSILAIPLGVTTTNFFVYFAFILLLSFFLILQNRGTAKRILLLLLSIFSVNAYWIFSFIYSLTSNALNVSGAKINLMASGDSFLLNKEAGTIQNISILKGFWFSNVDYFNDRQVFYLMFEPWLKHLNNGFILAIGYFLFLFVLLGIVYLVYKRNFILGYFVAVFLISVFLLLNENAPFGFLFSFITSLSPLLKESLRFPFTKFSIPASFSYSILFAFGTYFVYIIYLKYIKIKTNIAKVVLGVFLSSLLIVFALPSFTGNLIYNNLKVALPKEYSQTFDYLNSMPNGRIANLPQTTFWGWGYTSWGLRGSGFIWYGINSPVMDRAFDVWNQKNEQYYNEIQYAIYSKDSQLLKNVLEKYQITYILLDKNVITPGSNKATFFAQTSMLLNITDGVSLQKQFTNLFVYKNTLKNIPNNYIFAPQSYTTTSTSFKTSNIDPIYNSNGTYVTNPTSANASIFPFADDLSITNNSNYSFNGGAQIFVPNLNITESIPANISINEEKGKGLVITKDYIYPKIKNSKTSEIIYAPKFEEKVPLFKVKSKIDSWFLLDEEIFMPFSTLGSSNTVLLNKASSLVAFTTKNFKEISFADFYYSSEPSDCSGDSIMPNGSFGKLNILQGFSLISKNKSVCLPLNKKIEVKKTSVVQIMFDYKATNSAHPYFCLAGKTGCVNEPYKNNFFVSSNFKQLSQYIYVENSENLNLSFTLDNFTNQEEQVGIKNLVVRVFEVTEKISLAPTSKAYEIGSSIRTVKDATYSIDLSSYKGLSKTYTAGGDRENNYFNPEQKNCDNFNENEFSRKLNVFGKAYYEYKALDAISCDTLKTKNLTGDASWLINFQYENIKGKGMDICIAGTNLDKCMVQERLSNEKLTMKNEQFGNARVQSQKFVLPAYPSVTEYAINIGNQSIGREETVNKLYSVETSYIPYKWTKGIQINNEQLAINNEDKVKITKVEKKFSYYYDVEVANAGKDSLIVLSQSFDKGWGMYDKNSCVFGIKTPITCKKVGEQVLINNWENGFQLSNQPIRESANFIIIFWPQYLQFLGYLLLPISFTLLGISFFRKTL